MSGTPPSSPELARRLGLPDAVLVGLGAMLGAGVFAALGPAAQIAGPGLLIGLAIAAVVAYCNATSSARLAARYPLAGGTYVYGRERLGAFWGFLAGWGFVVGKTASCAAMALTFAAYLVPGQTRLTAALAIAALTAVNYFGVRKTMWMTRFLVVAVLLALGLVVVGVWGGGTGSVDHLRPFPGASWYGILQSAGLLFFAFAGYARIATLGEEVKEPARTIPRAISLALGVVLVIYAVVAVSALFAVGAAGLTGPAPLHDAVAAGSLHALAPAVRIGGAVAALGSLLALILGVSRTTLAMARDRRLPHWLAAVHPRHRVPHHAELAVGAVVIVVVLTVDLRGAIGFSSFAVLSYYAIANASALTLGRAEGRPPRWLPPLGLAGCLVLAFTLPLTSVLTGAGVLLLGVGVWQLQRVSERDSDPRRSDQR